MSTEAQLLMAKYFASTEHVIKRGQMYGPLPYTHHLATVVEMLKYFGVPESGDDLTYHVAAWLHDVREDCDIKDKTIREMFGPQVADLVDAVTDPPGPNRHARKAQAYEKIRATPGALVIKLADRLANVSQGGPLLQMYQKEHETFRRALYGASVEVRHEPIVQQMWEQLDAAF